MDFTREPIIESVITPKEGYKLIVRSSRGDKEEEYSVNAVEVVSFGKAIFFRNMEKPKAFLLPVSEYDVVETRETRSVLKKPQAEKSIKIAGGRVPPPKKEPKAKQEPKEEREEKEEPKRKRRTRKRKSSSDEPKVADAAPESSEKGPVTLKRTLLPPPPNLISDQISRYKDYIEKAPAQEEPKVQPIIPPEPQDLEVADQDSDLPPVPTPDYGDKIVDIQTVPEGKED